MPANDCSDISLMSAPAAKARSLPLSTAHRWDGSPSNVAKAFSRSASTWLLRALSAWGRFRVTTVTAPRCSTSRVS